MGANLACVNHFERPALFECKGCRNHVCEDCAKHTWVDGGFVDLCPNCGHELSTVAAVAQRQAGEAGMPDPGPASYLARIPNFIEFTINRSVLFMVLGLALITAPLYWAITHSFSMVFAIMGILIIKSLEAMVYFRMVARTSFGETDISPPDAVHVFDEMFGPMVRYLVALSPIIVGLAWYGSERFNSIWFGLLLFEVSPSDILDYPGPTILVGGGVVLLPLPTIIAAISGSAVAVLNPLMWVNALRVFGMTYLVAAAVYYAVFAFEVLVWIPMLINLRADYSIPVVTTMLTLVLAYLAMALRARVLGGLGEPYFNRFD